MMEHMGLRVMAEHPYRIQAEGRIAYIQDFEVQATDSIDVDALGPAFEEAFGRIWRGDAESDAFNRLILTAGLDWRQVAMLRGTKSAAEAFARKHGERPHQLAVQHVDQRGRRESRAQHCPSWMRWL